MLNRYVRLMIIAAACVAGKDVVAMEQTASSAAAPTTDIVASLISYDAAVKTHEAQSTPLMGAAMVGYDAAVETHDVKDTPLMKVYQPRRLPVGAIVPGLGMTVKEGDEVYVMEPGVLSINGMIYQTLL